MKRSIILSAIALMGVAFWLNSEDLLSTLPASTTQAPTAEQIRLAADPALPRLTPHSLVPGMVAVAVTGAKPSASEAGFVPKGGVIDPGSLRAPSLKTLNLDDPEERRFKEAAGDLDAPLDEEALIKANAHDGAPDSPLIHGDTAHPAPAFGSALEIHKDGKIFTGTLPTPTVTESHRDGKRPLPKGLSPTEANQVPPADLTRTILAGPVDLPADAPIYQETRVTPPAEVWHGPSTVRGGSPARPVPPPSQPTE